VTLTRIHYVFDTGTKIVRVSIQPGELRAFVQIAHRDIAVDLEVPFPLFSAKAQQRVAAELADRALTIYHTPRATRPRKVGAQ
jgi:hypothetical protein